MDINDISRLRRKRDYYSHDAPSWVRVIWPSANSFAWFIKSRRADLSARGALIRLGRDHFVDGSIFPSAARQILGLPDQDGAGNSSCSATGGGGIS